MLSTLAFAALLAICYLPGTATNPLTKATDNERPIIGVMTQAVTSPHQVMYGNIYLAANYVKYIESAGARVVPVLVNQTEEYYTMLYQSLNGHPLPTSPLLEISKKTFFPKDNIGGSALETDLLKTGLGKAAKFFYNRTIEDFDSSGEIFPLWGTCEGFELLTMLTAQKDLLTNTDTEDKALPLTLTADYKKSRMFGPSAMPDSILHILTKENVTFNAHHWSLTPKNFSSNLALKNFYRVITTNIDDRGVEFISTIEAFKYPIYGTQWHPEKNMFQWTISQIPHDMDAVTIAQHMANFLVKQARKSSHKFSSEEEEAKHLIYNFTPVNVGNIRDGQQVYFWTI